ncbi:MAG: class I SAM-dependent methyltransferase [Blastocatellia bacterium]|nr:class I SAM-dependent methyltransferase [Blastocatellia bacterium]
MERKLHKTETTTTFDNTKEYKLYRSIFKTALSPMTAGSLKIKPRNGEELILGSGEGGVNATIELHNPIFFKKCVFYGDIGFGESYVDGDWDTDDLTKVVSWFISNVDKSPSMSGSERELSYVTFLQLLNKVGHWLKPNTIRGSKENIHKHYDISNKLFQLFLDSSMTYSSGYFDSPDRELEAAQTEKYDRLCRKLKLQPSDHILEIGSGWGGFAVHAIKNYGCRITTVTISEEQFSYAKERFVREGVADRVDIQLKDYRLITGQYDKIVSIEMLEAVGHKFLKTFFAKCHEVLKKDGVMGLQVIICPDSRYDSFRKNVDWIQKYIFPGSLLPSVAAINSAINSTGDMFLHGLEEMGLHYAKTLATWRFNMNRNIQKVYELGFDERFVRMWNYYFSYCEAAFKMRNINVVQMVYSRPNNLKV